MSDSTKCPQCSSENIYPDGNLWVCPECSHEWSSLAAKTEDTPIEVADNSIRDAFGTPLASGDSVTLIKELKIKGSSLVVKIGTKVKNIRLGESADGHDIGCKIDGLGAINLKSEFVKKV